MDWYHFQTTAWIWHFVEITRIAKVAQKGKLLQQNQHVKIDHQERKQKLICSFSVPNGVSDLLVYTKNESSVSLRWKPPYPPTGILERYKINYYAGRSLYKKIAEFGITPCRLWPDLHCVTLSNLESNEEYSFLVRIMSLSTTMT